MNWLSRKESKKQTISHPLCKRRQTSRLDNSSQQMKLKQVKTTAINNVEIAKTQDRAGIKSDETFPTERILGKP